MKQLPQSQPQVNDDDRKGLDLVEEVEPFKRNSKVMKRFGNTILIEWIMAVNGSIIFNWFLFDLLLSSMEFLPGSLLRHKYFWIGGKVAH